MNPRAAARRALRGPVRNRVRRLQAAHPRLAPRTRPGPPDFVGVGVQRCGTSWWHSLIEAHPDVDPLGFGRKELHFFDDCWGGTDDGLADRYAEQFRRRAGHLAGEWTPRYLYDPWTLPLLRRAAPDAKLLVLLRDPVARFRSGVGHAATLAGSTSPPPDAITEAFERGRYAPQLRRLLDLVPREQVLVLQFEQCAGDPAGQLARTFAFLGLRPVALPERGATNAGRARVPIGDAVLGEVRARYRDDAAEVAQLFPDAIDLRRWTELT